MVIRRIYNHESLLREELFYFEKIKKHLAKWQDEDVDLHTFRHTSVYLARLGGADLLSISKRLGHKNISITADHYSDLFEETDKEVAQGLEKLQKGVI